MIKQVIDRPMFTLISPLQLFHGWHMNNRQLLFSSCYRYCGCSPYVQAGIRQNEPLQFSPLRRLWAAEITSSSQDLCQKTEAEDGLNPPRLPLQQALHANQGRAYGMSHESSQLNSPGAQEHFWKTRASLFSVFPWCWRSFYHIKT